MQIRRACLFVLPTALFLAGCSDGAEPERGDEDSSSSASASTNVSTGEDDVVSGLPKGTVTVHWNQDFGPVIYEEGAVADFTLIAAIDGTRPKPTRQVEGAWTWEALPPGTYILRAGLRPCDGSCDYLDSRTASCSDQLFVDGQIDVQVRLTAGRPCRVTYR